jgi:transposase-like protein
MRGDHQNDESYKDCKIVNIRKGKDARKNTIYAHLVDKDGKTLISATLSYITAVLEARLP